MLMFSNRLEGTSQELKGRLGNVVHLNILVDVVKSAEVKENISKILPGNFISCYNQFLNITSEGKIIAENAGSIVYTFPATSSNDQLKELIGYLQKVR